jgi:thiosulfate dehydrogenase [quinone] large subunit
MIIGYEWLAAGWEKLSGGNFVAGINQTLTKFATLGTPPKGNSNGWYVDFLKSTAIPNGELFANLVMYGQILVGIALLGGGLLLMFANLGKYAQPYFWLALISLVGGALMNLNFYLAAGWMSPSTSSVNLLMLLIQLVLIGFIYKFLTNKELRS